jgi:zinc transport system permease protein
VLAMDDFLLRALAAGFGLALMAGPLGSFVVWRRMAYFGDTLAHSALLGIALGFLLAIDLNIAVIGVCAALAVILVLLRQRQRLADDTLLGILAHSSLSLGLVALAFMEHVRVDLMSYLFGDILAVAGQDLVWIFGGGIVVLAALIALWRPLLAITIHEDIARADGIAVSLVLVGFMLLMAAVIAVAMKVVGILLVTSLLIIPAATARSFARTPEQMAIFAGLVGCVAVLLGLNASFAWDLPSGPAIVVAAATLFLLVSVLGGLLAALRGSAADG